ncbi:metallophosphoesterase family protein [Aestuariibacter salexigens]|uniref:metallophosphoesterase family protein n=1 Tax=Aestuariibacter salexigens TaxID=226010 RepID=UPI00040ED8B0|nr:metallophosphoesterase [Aestuariibacter salexigens]
MQSITIAQLSDCHLFEDEQYCGYGNTNPYRSLQQVVSVIKRHVPDMVLVTGDISGDDSRDSYAHFLHLIEQCVSLKDMYVIAGNHDQNPWFDRMLERHILNQDRPLQLPGWVLHGVDSRYRGTLGQVSENAMQRLISSIKNLPELRHCVAVHHHPLACQGWIDKHALVNGEEFMSGLATCQQATLVLHGHVHMQRQQAHAHLEVLGVPSTCWQWSNSKGFAVSDEKPGFRLITLFEDGRYKSEVIRLSE